MSELRRRVRIVLDGTPYELTTSARDMASVQGDSDEMPSNPMDFAFRLVHAAMIRLDMPGVPTDVDKFIDLIDDYTDLEPDTAAELPRPT